MKIKTKKTFSKKIMIPILIVLVIVAATATYIFAFNGSVLGWPKRDVQTTTSNVNYEAPTEEQKQNGESIKESTATKDQPAATDTQPTNNNASSTSNVIITSARQIDKGQPVHVSLLITGTIKGGEMCSITFSMTGQPGVTKTVAVTPQPANFSCVINVPASEFSMDGTWQMSAKVQSNNSTASNVATTNVEVKR